MRALTACHSPNSLSMFQVHQFSNKQTEMALRVASLDYLGTVAARLRKDAITSNMDQRTIDRILKEVQAKAAALPHFNYKFIHCWGVLSQGSTKCNPA